MLVSSSSYRLCAVRYFFHHILYIGIELFSLTLMPVWLTECVLYNVSGIWRTLTVTADWFPMNLSLRCITWPLPSLAKQCLPVCLPTLCHRHTENSRSHRRRSRLQRSLRRHCQDPLRDHRPVSRRFQQYNRHPHLQPNPNHSRLYHLRSRLHLQAVSTRLE